MWLDVLRNMKKQSGKTSQTISDETGIPKSTIDKLLTGRTKDPALSMVRSIVHCLGYTLDDLDDTKKDTAPTESSGDDAGKQKLISNYDRMNETEQHCLVEYSDYLTSKPENLKSSADSHKMMA